MTRWNNHQVPKHLLPVHGEPILLRTARLAQRYAPEAQVIITSHNPDYEAPGAVRYEPKSNSCEIDRFTWELIDDDVCFLYGDVYYTEQAIRRIVEMPVKALGFARNDTEVFAVKVADGAYQKDCIRKLKEKDPACRGWQLYEMAQRAGCAEICRMMTPPIPVVQQPEQELGRLAGMRLIERMSGSRDPARITRLPCRLIE